jgi:hypothetical protein
MFDSMAKLLILMGAILIIIGGVFLLAPKLPFLGRLPGDIAFRRGNWSFYFLLTTSILLSLLLTVLFNLFGRR